MNGFTLPVHRWASAGSRLQGGRTSYDTQDHKHPGPHTPEERGYAKGGTTRRDRLIPISADEIRRLFALLTRTRRTKPTSSIGHDDIGPEPGDPTTSDDASEITECDRPISHT
jgi:hypothetical protein